ncbi:arylesterase [Oleiagrimonas sp. C23AA]|uniref:arylesterase n=1 Tax=Oleiagrimonas sp. C23AA TaxID=2719047 RepID=UPI0014212AE8|nr:arylesterase [Oleiagrimonas sp. C23AA]NII11419.1 arylesterase [Oleiagrimonas sp. C23AA]
MRRFLCLLVLCVLPWAAMAATPTHTVLIVGDSLSAAHNIAVEKSWPALLAKRLDTMRPPWRVINASISGDTSVSGRQRLPGLLAKYQPKIVVLELGANDGLRGLSIDTLKGNLTAMIQASRKAGARVLLLGIELPVNYGPRYRGQLRAVYADLAKQFHAPLVPFLLEGVALKPELMQADGLHPTAAGEPRVLANVWEKLKPMLNR